MTAELIDCTVLIMTHNEEANISCCLTSVVNRFKRICVVDSGSTDNTIQIIKMFSGVEIYHNTFESWGAQRNWIYNEAKPGTKFVLFLDADETLSQDLSSEIDDFCKRDMFDIGEFCVSNYFIGKEIRFAYGHPSVKRLVRVSINPLYHSEGAREYPLFNGCSYLFESPLRHEDLKPLKSWLLKHVKNAEREADYLINHKKSDLITGPKAIIREHIWKNIPIFLRPIFYFFYRYVVRLGFLDGVPGFVFCFYQAYVYQMMISTLIFDEHSRGSSQ